jgi:hypothetical protein
MGKNLVGNQGETDGPSTSLVSSGGHSGMQISCFQYTRNPFKRFQGFTPMMIHPIEIHQNILFSFLKRWQISTDSPMKA